MICLLLPLALLRLASGPVSAAANCTAGDCKNGGVCNTFTDSPPCICPLPYIPPYCTAAANYCSTLQPEKGITELPVCRNGGNCTMTYSDPYFNCTCPPQFTGFRCNDTLTNLTTFTSTTLSTTIQTTGTTGPTAGTTSPTAGTTGPTAGTTSPTAGTTISTTTNATAVGSSTAVGPPNGGLAGGGIAGIVVGVIVVGVVAIGVAWWHKKKKGKIGCPQGESTIKEDQIAATTWVNPYAKPLESLNSLQNSSKNAVPNSSNKPVPNKNAVPDSSQNAVPDSSQNAVPDSSQNAVPDSWQNAVPSRLAILVSDGSHIAAPNSSNSQRATVHRERDRAGTVNETAAMTEQQVTTAPDQDVWASQHASSPSNVLDEEPGSQEPPAYSSRLDPIESRPSHERPDRQDKRRRSKGRKKRHSNAPVPVEDPGLVRRGSMEQLVESELA